MSQTLCKILKFVPQVRFKYVRPLSVLKPAATLFAWLLVNRAAVTFLLYSSAGIFLIFIQWLAPTLLLRIRDTHDFSSFSCTEELEGDTPTFSLIIKVFPALCLQIFFRIPNIGLMRNTFVFLTYSIQCKVFQVV